MSVVLPLQPSIPHYRVGTTLEDVAYLLDVRWNERAAAWYMDVLTEDEVPLRHGIRLVLGALLGSTVTDARFPPGVFIARDLSGAGIEAGLEDLGTRVIVYFVPDSERGL